MRVWKNIAALLIAVLAAAAGIFLPDILLKREGADTLGQVQQRDVDYHAGKLTVDGQGETSLENKLRLVSGYWKNHRTQVYDSGSGKDLPLWAEVFGEGAQAAVGEEKPAEGFSSDAVQKGEMQESGVNTDTTFYEEVFVHYSTCYSALESLVQEYLFYGEPVDIFIEEETSLEICRYEDAYFGKYRCWCLTMDSKRCWVSAAANSELPDRVDIRFRAVYDLETAKLMRLDLSWDAETKPELEAALWESFCLDMVAYITEMEAEPSLQIEEMWNDGQLELSDILFYRWDEDAPAANIQSVWKYVGREEHQYYCVTGDDYFQFFVGMEVGED